MGYGYGWRPYVPVAVKRMKAQREMARLAKRGRPAAPVVIEGRAIAKTFTWMVRGGSSRSASPAGMTTTSGSTGTLAE